MLKSFLIKNMAISKNRIFYRSHDGRGLGKTWLSLNGGSLRGSLRGTQMLLPEIQLKV